MKVSILIMIVAFFAFSFTIYRTLSWILHDKMNINLTKSDIKILNIFESFLDSNAIFPVLFIFIFVLAVGDFISL